MKSLSHVWLLATWIITNTLRQGVILPTHWVSPLATCASLLLVPAVLLQGWTSCCPGHILHGKDRHSNLAKATWNHHLYMKDTRDAQSWDVHSSCCAEVIRAPARWGTGLSILTISFLIQLLSCFISPSFSRLSLSVGFSHVFLSPRNKSASACQCRQTQETWVQSLGQEDPRRRKGQPRLVFLPGKSYGQSSLASYSPWGLKELTTTKDTEHTHTHTHSLADLYIFVAVHWVLIFGFAFWEQLYPVLQVSSLSHIPVWATS